MTQQEQIIILAIAIGIIALVISVPFIQTAIENNAQEQRQRELENKRQAERRDFYGANYWQCPNCGFIGNHIGTQTCAKCGALKP
jgi:rubrerythrin